jgi:hypothetical protein
VRSLADKLYNTRTILRDQHAEDEHVSDRFTAPSEDVIRQIRRIASGSAVCPKSGNSTKRSWCLNPSFNRN